MNDVCVAHLSPVPDLALSSVAPATEPLALPSLPVPRRRGRPTTLSTTGAVAVYLRDKTPRRICEICHQAPQDHPKRLDPYCKLCRQQMRAPATRRKMGNKAQRIGNGQIVMLFDQYLGDRSLDCMSEMGAYLAGKAIIPSSLSYATGDSPLPTCSQLFSRIVAKYDTEQRLLPAIKELFKAKRFTVPRYMGRSRTLWLTPKDLTFSLIDYLKPSDDSSFKRLADMQDQMNLMAKKILLADELPLAISTFNNIATGLHKATASNLWECFEATLIKALRLRVMQQSTARFLDDAKNTLTSSDVEKLASLTKIERELRGEIGASPKAAKRLGLGTGDSMSELVDRASRLTGGRGPTFVMDDEQEAGRELLGRESSLGTDLAQSEDDAGRLPEADVALALRETIDHLLKEA